MAKKKIIDVASYQSHFTVNDYKKTGAEAIVIKLTESTNYVNPYVKDQINKASDAGIKHLHFYHFQRATSVEGMKAEARFCIAQAKKLNLKDCYIFLDAELANAVPSEAAVLAFYNEIRKAGFKAGFYTYQFMYPKFSKKCFTASDGFWAAAYPLGNRATSSDPNMNYFPSQENCIMWQFTDNWKGMNVDGSIDIDGRLFKESDTNNEKPKEKDEYYHSKRVKKLRPKVDCDLHETQALTTSKVVGKAKKDKEYRVVDVWKEGDKPTDLSRYKIEFEKGKFGWISGNMKYIDSVYYLDCKYGNRTKIQALRDTAVCYDKELKREVCEVKKGDVLQVVDNVTDGAGYPRLKVSKNGYVTARKDFWKFV